MATLAVEIVTGERVVYRADDVNMVVAPGADGTLGILPHHAALISLLAYGELRIKRGGQEESLVVFGGFIEVTHDKVVVLADSAERAAEIDLARAEAARRRAEEELARRQDTVSITQAEAALRRSAIRLRVGRRRHAGRGAPVPATNEP